MRLRLLHHPATAWLVLLLSLALTAWAWQLSERAVRQRAQERFAFQAEDVRRAIARRMFDYEGVLRSGAALFSVMPAVQRADWRRFVAELRLQHSFPGIQGLGYSEVFPPEALAAHTARIRAEGFPDYTPRPPGLRDRHSAIIYLEPFDWRNQRAFGFDMLSEAVRRQAMGRACDTGQPTMSGRVHLVQETERDVQGGLLMYLPVYRRGLPLSSVEERRAALRGYVYSPFRINDLMFGILGADQRGLDFELFDGPLAEAGQRLYASHPERPVEQAAPWHSVQTLEVGGRIWTLRLLAQAGYDSIEGYLPVVVGVSGIVVDLLLFFITLSIRREHAGGQRVAGVFAKKTLAAVEQERSRLSRELHDEIGQALTALRLALERGPKGGEWPGIHQAREIAVELVATVRQLAHRLRPSQLDDLGLAAAIRWHIDKVVRPAGLQGVFWENLGERRLSPEIEVCCFRIAQEALTNVMRHAQASTVVTTLIVEESMLSLSIVDDGCGFDPRPYHEGRPVPTLGLVGMRERVDAVGGSLELQAVPGGGCTLYVRIPLQSEET